MIKQNALFIAVFGLCSIVQIEAMETVEYQKNPGSLNFYLGNKRKIKRFQEIGMACATKPSEFKGKDILKAIPVEKQDQDTLKKAFATARKTNEKVQASYSLNSKRFLATITPLIRSKKSEKRNFFVEIHQISGSPKIVRDMPDVH